MAISTPTDAYCTLNDVLELLPNRVYDASSKPTLQQAENLVIDKALQINGILRSLGYATPLTGSDDVKLLRYINKIGGAYMVETATNQIVGNDNESAQEYKEEYGDLITQLRKGELLFTDAGGSETSEAESNSSLSDSGTRADALFKMSQSERKNQF